MHPHVLDAEPGGQQNGQGDLAASSAECLPHGCHQSSQVPHLEAEQGEQPGLQVTTGEQVAEDLGLETHLRAVGLQQVWQTVFQA